jgi:hypothetical protein
VSKYFFCSFNRLFTCLLCLTAMTLFSCRSASAQVLTSNNATVALNAVLNETLGISASPATVNFSLAAGASTSGSTPVVVTTSWVLAATRASVNLYAWFATPSAALTDGATTPNNIPSAEVYASLPSGIPTTLTAFTQSNTLGIANGGLKLFTQSITSTNRQSNRSDSVTLQINLTNQTQLPAGTYTGTLNLQMQAL